MEDKEIEIRKLELERAHQNSILIKRGTNGKMSWESKVYYTDLDEQNVLVRQKKLKEELDTICEVGQ